ncbi:hypothetical protein DES40_0170 [Litorimonas taeanensis]|uniref:DUF1989 domain-containing protein n=1 Tax=Litorimonas taeanensis TaxID=568099 RepID=A0A420WIN9_9PROT|nr:urea carboxylase-associated family protein [Litorimonas taeanensis]RKQ70868.1 hypothetical protein DES40_0170 [Litorimonas taeanensis]
MSRCRIKPRTGTSFIIKKGQYLKVTDPEGQQVSDMLAYNAADKREYISSGRSFDYASRIFLTTGDVLYSNRSRQLMTIVNDEVGRHDFTLTPCSKDTFRIIYGDKQPHHGCQGNLERALARHEIEPDNIPCAFNIFMNVDVNGRTGEIKVLPPLSEAGQSVTFRAEMDLIVALTACSAGQSNNFTYKPIDYEVLNTLTVEN